VERARMIYQYALENLPEGQKENLYNVYTQFEKQYGSKDGLEDVIVSKRRLKYEQVSKHLIIGIITKSI
jgi:crooked neck